MDWNLSLFLFWGGWGQGLSMYPGWLGTHCVDQAILIFTEIHLHLFPEHWNQRLVPASLVFIMNLPTGRNSWWTSYSTDQQHGLALHGVAKTSFLFFSDILEQGCLTDLWLWWNAPYWRYPVWQPPVTCSCLVSKTTPGLLKNWVLFT